MVTVRSISFLCLSLASLSGFAQIKINTNSKVVGTGVVSTNTTITNSSSNVDLSKVDLHLVGDGDQQITATQPITLSTLKVDQGGGTTITGNVEVRENIELVKGLIHVENGSKLLYSGTENPEGHSHSYIVGYYYRSAQGKIIFPVGTDGNYLPVTIEDSDGAEIGVNATEGDALLTIPAQVTDYYTGHYWEFSSAPNSTISLSLNGLNSFLTEGVPIVLTSDAISSEAKSLSGALSTDFVTSVENATQKIAAIGMGAEFRLVIHDMITPFTIDNKNDKLTIENLELVTGNIVKLVDRWGAIAIQWENYTNDSEYDFSKLSPGNYVCIVEFAYPGATKKSTINGIVTILK